MNILRALLAIAIAPVFTGASLAGTGSVPIPLPDGSRFVVANVPSSITDPFAFGVEARSIAGPFPRTIASLAILRVKPCFTGFIEDCAIDTTWADRGLAHIPVWGEEDAYQAHAIDPEGRLLVLGRAPDPAQVQGNVGNLVGDDNIYNLRGRSFYLALYRLTPDGKPDPAFGGTGRVVFRLGPYYDNWDSSAGNTATRLVVRADLAISVLADTEIARIADDGTVLPIFPYAGDRDYGKVHATTIEFAPAQEFVNDRDQYFLTATPEEAAFLDRGGAGPWHRTGRAIRTFVPGTPGQASLPSCRFYGDPSLGLGNHFYSVDAAECDLLARDPSLGWKLESRDVFRLEKPDPVSGACGPGRDAVFRLLARRGDSAHRYTTDWNLARAAVESGRWLKEGYGPDTIAMCAPVVPIY